MPKAYDPDSYAAVSMHEEVECIEGLMREFLSIRDEDPHRDLTVCRSDIGISLIARRLQHRLDMPVTYRLELWSLDFFVDELGCAFILSSTPGISLVSPTYRAWNSIPADSRDSRAEAGEMWGFLMIYQEPEDLDERTLLRQLLDRDDD